MRTLPSELHTIVSKDTNYEFHIDSQGRVYWWWGPSFQTNGYSITLNQWHHIAVTYRSGSQVIYVDGVVRATAANTGALPQNNLPFYVGTDWNLIARAFDGFIDEVRILPRYLTQAEVQALRRRDASVSDGGRAVHDQPRRRRHQLPSRGRDRQRHRLARRHAAHELQRAGAARHADGLRHLGARVGLGHVQRRRGRATESRPTRGRSASRRPRSRSTTRTARRRSTSTFTRSATTASATTTRKARSCSCRTASP